MDKAKRQSNIELLRIITICGVIVLHYNNVTIGGGMAYAKGVNLYILYCLESLFACAVDLFVLISGYFMCTKQKRALSKPFELIVQVILFNEFFYVFSLLVHHEHADIKHILGRLIPANWFVILYITLYFISPFLNVVIQKVEENGIFKKFVVTLLLLFSVYPTFVDVLGEFTHKEYIGLSSVGMYGSQWGYSIINFSLMYIIGAYLRMYPDKNNIAKNIARIYFGVVVLTIWAFVNNKTGFATERSAWEYCNPLVIFMAVEIFRTFSQIEMGNRKGINKMAGASFTVYLLHNRFLKFLQIPYFVSKSFLLMILHIIISVMLIYIICTIIDICYSRTILWMLRAIWKKIPIFKKDIFEVNGDSNI